MSWLRTVSSLPLLFAVSCGAGQSASHANAQAEALGSGGDEDYEVSASVKADASADVSTGKDGKKESAANPEKLKLMPAAGDGVDGGSAPPSAAAEEARALVGARQDLQLADDPPKANCRCLAARLGQAHDPFFFWSASPPNTKPGEHIVLAFTSTGLPCDYQSADGMGASYWGYRQEGNDLIVVLEEARQGRPVTTGAVLPAPPAGGHVYLAPSGKKVPYGLGPNGEPRCQLQ